MSFAIAAIAPSTRRGAAMFRVRDPDGNSLLIVQSGRSG
jgi:hypothetical protein